jgi:IAA-amino acid hydrolase
VSPLDSIVVSVTMVKAGTASNIIPDHTEVSGTLRALNVHTFDYGIERLQEIAKSIGHAYRCNVTVSWGTVPVYPPTVNEPAAWSFAKAVGAKYALCRFSCFSCTAACSSCITSLCTLLCTSPLVYMR